MGVYGDSPMVYGEQVYLNTELMTRSYQPGACSAAAAKKIRSKHLLHRLASSFAGGGSYAFLRLARLEAVFFSDLETPPFFPAATAEQRRQVSSHW